MLAASHDLGKSRLSLWTGVLIVMMCLALLVLSIFHQWQSRHSELRTAKNEMRNLAKSSTVFANDVIDLAETLIGALVYRMEAGGNGESGAIKLKGYLAQRNFSTSRIRGLFVYDNEGRWLATSEQIDTIGFNNSDRDYFKYHRASNDRRSFFGLPVRSRSGGQ
ncbi:MAG TPA: hypothetical protein VMM15_23335 [Bradyrhizobium sp.]|nr:hypothetical protein [Bradyrhizobium sp.]